ncbi:MAG TPA: hypothetical protein VIV11_39775 [Kofleriaceae bacterium]
MIAYDKRGAVFALTEGAELLMHDGDSEAPLWRTTLDAAIVGVGVDGERVIAVTAAGSIRTFGSRSGDVRGHASIAGPVRRACVDATADRVCAITEREVVLVAGGSQRVLGADSAHAIAMRPDGAIVVATASDLIAFAPDGGRTTRPLAGKINTLAHHPEGFWVLGLPTKLQRWDGSGEPTHITNLPPNSNVEHVACSDRVLAVSWDRHMVAALAWPSKETLGSLQYLERNVEGLAVGPWPWLGVALDLGDGNKFNLDTAALHRSDTHPGRDHHSWLVSVGGSGRDEESPRPAPRAPSSPSTNPLAILLTLAAIAVVIFLVVR